MDKVHRTQPALAAVRSWTRCCPEFHQGRAVPPTYSDSVTQPHHGGHAETGLKDKISFETHAWLLHNAYTEDPGARVVAQPVKPEMRHQHPRSESSSGPSSSTSDPAPLMHLGRQRRMAHAPGPPHPRGRPSSWLQPGPDPRLGCRSHSGSEPAHRAWLARSRSASL